MTPTPVTQEDLLEMARRDGLTDAAQLDTVLAVRRRDYYAATIKAYRAGIASVATPAAAQRRGDVRRALLLGAVLASVGWIAAVLVYRLSTGS